MPEQRAAAYDAILDIEAQRFSGMARPFPNHFHERYVIGLMEGGARTLNCKGQTYALRAGSVLLLNPGDSHSCAQTDGGGMDYRALSIPPRVMLRLAEEIAHRRELPALSPSVVEDQEIASALRALHERVMRGCDPLRREEALWLLATLLMRKCAQAPDANAPACREEIRRACAFMEARCDRSVSLDEICRAAGLSKSTLLRAFVKARGVTPYAYLENIRIDRARALLERGATPIDAALQTGFSDQIHFTNCFRRFIGLTPAAYRAIFRDTDDS